MSHCYVACKAGEPGAYAACADMKNMPEETTRFIQEMVAEGAIVRHVSTEQAREMLAEWFSFDDGRR